MRSCLTIAGALLAMMTASASAQRVAGNDARVSASCRAVDTTASWYQKQRQYLDESGRDWSNDSLRIALLRATGVSDAPPLPLQYGVHIENVDAATPVLADAQPLIARLRSQPRSAVWPTRSVVGPAGTRAVLALALRDSTFARTAMHRMMEAGPSESLGADVALLEDHTRLAAGRKQLFGTQLRVGKEGQVMLAPMEDSAHADLRREGAGLPPLAVSLCLAREQHR